MNGWKVIKKKSRKSARASEWYTDEKYCVTYPLRKQVRPKVKGTKLMFFVDKADAQSFMKVGERVVPCVATGAVKMVYIGDCVGRIDDFWKCKKNKIAVGGWAKHAPMGTYGADTIKCLK